MSASRMRDTFSRAACFPPSPPDPCCAARRAVRLGAALLLLALSLLPTVPAQAQDKVEVWSATLDVADLPALESVGCSNFFLPEGTEGTIGFDSLNRDCIGQLSEYRFRYDDTDYEVHTVDLEAGDLGIILGKSDLTERAAKLILEVDGTEFAFTEADGMSVIAREWEDSGLSWSEGDSIRLKLLAYVPPKIITTVMALSPDGIFVPGDTITLAVLFNEPVVVTAGDSPLQALLIVGSNERWAQYDRGSGLNQLVFRYTVQEGDRDDDGVTIGTNALAVNATPSLGPNGGGTIRSVASGLDADLTNPPVDNVAGQIVAELPGAPTGLDAVSVGQTEILMNWTAPSDDGGAAVTQYEIEAKTDGTWETVARTTGAGATVTLSLRMPGTTYELRVVAISAAGTGPPSNEVASTTDHPLPPSVTVPAGWSLKPSGLTGGSRFRLLVVESKGLSCRSRDIGHYNRHFMHHIGNSGHTDIRAYADGFRVLGSTARVNAKANTGTETGTGVPIYWLNGDKVADDNADLYDGSWASHSARWPSGNAASPSEVTTGSWSGGTSHGSAPLGGATCKLGELTAGQELNSGVIITFPAETGSPFYVMSQQFVVDQGPTIASVEVTSDPGADETYAIGDAILVTVTFSEAVSADTSGGTPRIRLRIGGADPEHLKWAEYADRPEDAKLRFSYVVQEDDMEDNGIFIEADELELNGGRILGAGDAAAELGYTRPGAQSGHKVEGVRPTFVSAETSMDGFTVFATFSENPGWAALEKFVLLDGDAPDDSRRIAGRFVAVTITNDVIELSLPSHAPIRHGVTRNLEVQSDAVRDVVGNSNSGESTKEIINNVPETALGIESVAITSTAATGGNYATGEAIEVTVTFSEAVTVDTTGGTPRLRIDLGQGGDDGRQAAYTSDSDSAALVFSYTVAAGDESGTAGIALRGDGTTQLDLDLDGGTIRGAGGVDADLSRAGLSPDPDHRVNWARPMLVENGAATSADGASVVLTFDEALSGTRANSGFEVKVDGSGVVLTGTPTFSGRIVTLTLAAAVTAGQTVTVSYSDPTTDDDTSAIEDLRRNDADSFTDYAVTNTVLDPGTEPPIQSGDLTATEGTGKVRLAWTAASGARGYEYRRRDGAGAWGPWKQAADGPLSELHGATTFDDYDVASLTTYTYEVRAAGAAAALGAASATLGPPIRVSFGARSYRVAEDAGWLRPRVEAVVPTGWSNYDRPFSVGLEVDRGARPGRPGLFSVGDVMLYGLGLVFDPDDFDESGRASLTTGIEILDDTRTEGEETMHLRLQRKGLPDFFVFEPNGAAMLTIEDNEHVAAALSALSLVDETVTPAFDPDRVGYAAWVANAVSSVTVAATPYDAGASVAIEPADADANAEGHQVTLGAGATRVTVTVTAPSAQTTSYTLHVNRAKATAPSAPGSLRATAGTGKVGLAWTAPPGSVEGYHARRREGGGSWGPWTEVGGATAHDDYDVLAGTTYGYQVRAYNADGASPASAQATAETGPAITLRFAREAYRVAEDAGTVLLTVVAERPAGWAAYDRKIRASAGTRAGTAQGMRDYRSFTHGLAFAPEDFIGGVAYGDVAVEIAEDGVVEEDESFTVELWGGGGATRFFEFGEPATVTIAGEGASAALATVSDGLTARIEPEAPSHSGTGTLSFRIVFSAPVTVTEAAFASHSLVVTGGRLESASRVAGEPGVWSVEVSPSSPEAPVGILPRGDRPCEDAGALCTADGIALSPGVAMMVAGGAPAAPAVLTGFVLVDATAHADVGAVEDGARLTEIDPAKVYGFRAEVAADDGTTPDDDVESVTFVLSGSALEKDEEQTESWAPYSLYGDSGGNEHGAALADGTYTLTATAWSEDGGEGDALETLSVAFTVGEAAPETAAEPLSAAFEAVPESHAGPGTQFTLRVAFSEPIGIEEAAFAAHGLIVGNGTVSAAARIEGAPGAWEVTLAPASRAAVTVALAADRACGEEGALCTADGRALGSAPAASIAGPGPVLAGFELVDLGANGKRTALGDGMELTLANPSGGSYGIVAAIGAGRTVGSVAFVLDEPGEDPDVTRTESWAPYSLYGDGGENAIDGAPLPAGRYTLTATAYAEKNLGGAVLGTLSVSFTARAAETATVAETPLTAVYVDMPSEHDGSSAFTFRVRFSEDVKIGFAALRDSVFAVHGAEVTGARRVDGRQDLREITVKPTGRYEVRIDLDGNVACDQARAICTAGGKMLSNALTATVPGPPGLSVADATATEGAGATLDFRVTLDRAASGPVTVQYATVDSGATAGEDYEAASGTLSFQPGETLKTVSVTVLDDAVDDGGERVKFVLFNATGAWIADSEAFGTIENSDPMPSAWLVRFGRTVGSQVVDAVTARFEAPAASHLTLGGQRLSLDGEAGDAEDADRLSADDEQAARETLTALADRFADPADPADGGARDRGQAGVRSVDGWMRDGWMRDGAGAGERTMTGRELLLGSSFHLAAGGEDGAAAVAAWGRVATGGFDAEVDEVRLDGDVTTAMLGADVGRGRWLAGAAVTLSEGTGGYAFTSDAESELEGGDVESRLTGIFPYARLALSERVSAWGLLGYGTGTLTLTEERGEAQKRYSTDIGLRMGAVGMRGTLIAPEEAGGFELAIRTDAMLLRTTSDATGGMAASESDASRLRLILDGSRSFEAGGGTLTPRLEVGLRHDGGDAETGTGVEVGAGLSYQANGIAVEGAVRTLIAHEDEDYREWGASGSVRIDPGASGRGLSLTLSPTWGNASSGTERLWGLRDASGLAASETFEPERRLDAEMGYGLSVLDGRGMATPYAGWSQAGERETLRLGQRLRLGRATEWRLEGELGEDERIFRAGYGYSLGSALTFTTEASRREPANDDAPEHALMLRATMRW